MDTKAATSPLCRRIISTPRLMAWLSASEKGASPVTGERCLRIHKRHRQCQKKALCTFEAVAALLGLVLAELGGEVSVGVYARGAALRLLLSSVLLAVWPGVGVAVLGAGLLLLLTAHLKLLRDGAATSLVRIFVTIVSSLSHGE